VQPPVQSGHRTPAQLVLGGGGLVRRLWGAANAAQLFPAHIMDVCRLRAHCGLAVLNHSRLLHVLMFWSCHSSSTGHVPFAACGHMQAPAACRGCQRERGNHGRAECDARPVRKRQPEQLALHHGCTDMA